MSRTERFALEVTCNLDDDYFAVWDELPGELQKFWEDTDDQPHCEGSGAIGTWCNGCPFNDLFDVSEE